LLSQAQAIHNLKFFPLTQDQEMIMKMLIESKDAPQAIGAYSQAIRTGNTIYLSGQIGLNPETMEMAEGIDAQIRRVFLSLQAVAAAAGGDLDDIVKLTVYLTELTHFPRVNEIMAGFFKQPYPARATIGVAALPRNALVEIDAVLVAP
jgi:reactive intermediate/imine deaminase